jgi:hypothetical protein
MLRHRTRTFFTVVAPLLAAAPLILATPSKAAAQVSWGVGVVVGHDQGRPPLVRGSVYLSRNSREYQFAYNSGYSDGREKGRDDGRHRRSFDPSRHRWYRSADHNYSRRYGARFEYEQAYRDGFRTGYGVAFRGSWGYRRDHDDRW